MSEEVFVASIDQGTSSSRAVLFSTATGNIVASHQIEISPAYPVPGWIEMDADIIYSTTLECLNSCVDQIIAKGGNIRQIAAVGISNQRETTVVWDKRSGKPLAPAIVWSDARTSDLVKQLAQVTPTQSVNAFQKVTGLPIHSYFSAVKICWLLKNVPQVNEVAREGHLLTGTIDSWLVWCLTKGRLHVTDVTNASRTLLFNLSTLDWDDKLCRFFQIEKQILPLIVSSAEILGAIQDPNCKMVGVRISGILGDQQASLVGQTWGLCPSDDDDGSSTKGPTVKVTYGTGAFMLWNIGKAPFFSDRGILTTVAYKIGKDAPRYALEGAIAFSGATMTWLQQRLHLFSDYAEQEAMASQVHQERDPNSADPCYLVPAFNGLFCPWWQESARGLLAGLTADVERADLVYAGLRSSVYQTHDVLQVATRAQGDELDDELQPQHQQPEASGGIRLTVPREIVVDGGLANSEVFLQSLADILDMTVRRHYNFTNMSALGAATAAALGVGIDPMKGLLKARDYPPDSQTISTFRANLDPHTRHVTLNGWHAAVERSLGWLNSFDSETGDSIGRLLDIVKPARRQSEYVPTPSAAAPALETPKRPVLEVSLAQIVIMVCATALFGFALAHFQR